MTALGLRIAGGQRPLDRLADANAGRPRGTSRRRALGQAERVGAALDARQGARPQHIGPGPVCREAQPRIRALAKPVVVARQGLAVALVEHLEIGVEVSGAHDRFQPLAGPGPDEVVVIAVGVVRRRSVAIRDLALNGPPGRQGLRALGQRRRRDRQRQQADGGENGLTAHGYPLEYDSDHRRRTAASVNRGNRTIPDDRSRNP